MDYKAKGSGFNIGVYYSAGSGGRLLRYLRTDDDIPYTEYEVWYGIHDGGYPANDGVGCNWLLRDKRMAEEKCATLNSMEYSSIDYGKELPFKQPHVFAEDISPPAGVMPVEEYGCLRIRNCHTIPEEFWVRHTVGELPENATPYYGVEFLHSDGNYYYNRKKLTSLSSTIEGAEKMIDYYYKSMGWK